MDVITYTKLKKLIIDAPEALDTLKEISDWIEANELTLISDENFIKLLIENNLLLALKDNAGNILTDESNNILLW